MRVLEIGSGVAAAFCGRMLARWGAEVTRVDLPPTAGSGPWAAIGDEGDWLDRYLNGGKQRVVFEYREAAGRRSVSALAAGCDLVVIDCSPRETEELRLLELGGEGRPAVRTSITPFGLSGPYRDWKATPATLLALGGQSFLMGDPGRAPLTMPGHYPEYQAALFAYIASVAALLEHEREGGPSRTIEVSILEAMVTLHQHTTVQWTYGGNIRSRHGNRFGDTSHPLTMVPCADGWFGMCITPNFWEPFTGLLRRPELATDERFATGPARAQHADELDAIMIECFAARTKRELMIEGQEQWRVPVGIVASLDENLDDQHLAERGFWQEVETPDGARLRLPSVPYRFAGEPPPREAAALASDVALGMGALGGAAG